MVVARDDARKADAPRPPRQLVPMLEFKHLPDSALGLVRSALEGEEGFRRRVAERAPGAGVDEASRLYLERPEGWAEALAALASREEERGAIDELERSNRELSEQLASASERSRSQEVRAAELSDEVKRLGQAADRAAGRERELTERVEALHGRIDGLEQARAEAVRQLKAAEDLATRRLQRQRELEEELRVAGEAPPAAANEVQDDPAVPRAGAPAPGRGDDAPGSRTDPEVLAALSRSVATFAEKLCDLGEAAKLLAGDLAVIGGDPDPRARRPEREHRNDVAESAQRPAAAPRRGSRGRTPRPGRGLALDTAEGFTEMLGDPTVLVLVDGYNVSMQGWPRLPIATQRSSLIQGLGSLGARSSAELQVVFDGSDSGQRPAVASPLPVRVHFTPEGTEADDQLLAFAAGAGRDRSVIVVSSDRRVRTGATERGAGAVSSSTLLEVMRSR